MTSVRRDKERRGSKEEGLKKTQSHLTKGILMKKGPSHPVHKDAMLMDCNHITHSSCAYGKNNSLNQSLERIDSKGTGKTGSQNIK